ncbi:hypothetical protein DSO57_1000092 [Entomophthora muscae]|uniref:Uncharacterized protein n=1 Tax=Entomophthora muscae TaxID=34485 RepID=A0ACC2SME0_9FUNG|nr:hypothetical protein DSO57_1000092 [Entomophthora muscae]
MEDIKKLVADLVTKQTSVAEEKKTITKGLIEVSNILDDYAKEMEELEQSNQLNKQQKLVEQTKKKPQILLCKPVAPVTKKEKEKDKPSNQHDSTEKTLLNIQKEVSAFKKLVNGRTFKKSNEALNPSTVKPIPEGTDMG